MNALDSITPLALDGPSIVAVYGPLVLWSIGLLAAFVFATRRTRVFRIGGVVTVCLLVALAGLHAQAIQMAQAQTQTLWGAYLQSGVPFTAQDAPTTGAHPTNQQPVVMLNSHLLDGLREAIQEAADAGRLGRIVDTQPRTRDGVWAADVASDVYGAPLPPNATVVALLNPLDDPKGAPATPPSANVVRVFIGATNAEGVLDMGAPRRWQAHHGIFQTPTFPWPLATTTPWEPVTTAYLVDEVVEIVSAGAAR